MNWVDRRCRCCLLGRENGGGDPTVTFKLNANLFLMKLPIGRNMCGVDVDQQAFLEHEQQRPGKNLMYVTSGLCIWQLWRDIL